MLSSLILGIGDWGLGIGDWGLPNPQSPISILNLFKYYILFYYIIII